MRQSGRCVMMLGQSQHSLVTASSRPALTAREATQWNSPFQQKQPVYLIRTLSSLLCILLSYYCTVRFTIKILSSQMIQIKDLSFLRKYTSDCDNALWFCVCSIWRGFQLSEFENCEWEYCEEWRNGCSSWLTLNSRPGQRMLWMWHCDMPTPWWYVLHIAGQQQQSELWHRGVKLGDTTSPW